MTQQCRFISLPIFEALERADTKVATLLRTIEPNVAGDYIGAVKDSSPIYRKLNKVAHIEVSQIYQWKDRLLGRLENPDPSNWIQPYWIYTDLMDQGWFVCKSQGSVPVTALLALAGEPLKALIETTPALGELEIISALDMGGVTVHAYVRQQWRPI